MFVIFFAPFFPLADLSEEFFFESFYSVFPGRQVLVRLRDRTACFGLAFFS